MSMPITLMAVNGNTAAWLAGAHCSAVNISRPNSGPASSETASNARHRAAKPRESRYTARNSSGKVTAPATLKRKKVMSVESMPRAMPQRAKTV